MKLLIITQKVDKDDQLLGFFLSWLERLSKHFELVTVICLEKKEFSLPENVKVISLGKEKKWPKLIWLLNFYIFIFKLKNEYGAVLVHMNPIWMVLGGLCWRFLGKKNYLWYTSGGITFKLKLAEKLTHQVFTASYESFRVPSKKVIVTGHGIDTGLFQPNYQQPATSNQLRVLSVGRIAPVKNYGVLVEAADILRKEGLNFSITMVGEAVLDRDKEYGRELKTKVKDLNLENYFNFVGKINNRDLAMVYRNHDLFVHLSKTGSLDKGLLEAMASGMRVLSSNDWSKRNLPAELVFQENSPKELADKIQNISNMDFREQLRDYVVKNHNLDNLIAKISDKIKKYV